MEKKNVVVIFGGKSPEHEVSIITGFQAAGWINSEKYNLFLVYLDYENRPRLCPQPLGNNYKAAIEKALTQSCVEFTTGGINSKGWLNKHIKIDVAVLATHGGSGENGELQGLLDTYGIPYTGCGVLSSALGMDKIFTKQMFAQTGVKVIPYEWFLDTDYNFDSKGIIAKIEQNLIYPLFVKPARSGSSVGISRVKNKKELDEAIKQAITYDNKIIVEEEVKEAIDINCAVMGGRQLTVSLCEQPLKEDEFLSFEEKYLKGGKVKGMASLNRIIPAPIPDKITEEIQAMASTIFKAMECWGNVRIDFLYQKHTGKVYPGEINTIPGSLVFYLWKASGIEPEELVQRMIDLALEKQKMVEQLNYSYKSKILEQK
jgi:D-alanine-D-alanine ligase